MNSIPFFWRSRYNCLQLLDADTHIVVINLLVCLLNLQIKQTACSLTKYVIFFYNFFNNDVMVSTLVNLNSSTAHCTGNCKMGLDCRLRCRRDRQICPDSSRLSPTSFKLCTHRRRDATRVCRVGGVYRALRLPTWSLQSSPLQCCHLTNGAELDFCWRSLGTRTIWRHKPLQCAVAMSSCMRTTMGDHSSLT